VLYAFWKSFHEKKTIVLVRQIKGEYGSLFVFLLNGEGPRQLLKWNVDSIEQAVHLVSYYRKSGCELCLDGIKQEVINQHLGTLPTFSVLATSAQYKTKSDDPPVLDLCLVPFWAFSDLKEVGKHKEWDEPTIEKKNIITLEEICDRSYWMRKRPIEYCNG
jgi:hypothetical protein